MSLTISSLPLRAAVAAVLLSGVYSQAAVAADAVLMSGPTAKITASDVEADSLRMPEEMRPQVLQRVNTVQQITGNLYVRRVMADEAAKLKLDKDEDVQAALRIARDKVLSDAFLARVDKAHAVDDQAALAQARASYQAKPDRFKVDEQVRVRHILIEGNDQAARAKAQELLKAARSGANFAELAEKNSIDKGSAPRGGDLGLVPRGRTVPQFETAAYALKNVGDVSDVVETQFGLHIIKLEERKPAGVQPFEEVQETLVKEVKAKIAQDARVAAAEKIGVTAKPDVQAIEAFAATHGPKK